MNAWAAVVRVCAHRLVPSEDGFERYGNYKQSGIRIRMLALNAFLKALDPI
jgi:hypothetical protein